MLLQTYSKKQNNSIHTQNHDKKFFFCLFEYIRMKMKAQKSIVLKSNLKNLMTSLLPMVKRMINKKINQIKSGIMRKILPNKLKKRQNTPKKVSNRRTKSSENNFSVVATKNIINTPEIAIDKRQRVTKPEVVTINAKNSQ